MAEWPKTVYVRGVGVQVDSWEDLDEIIKRYGSQMILTIPTADNAGSSAAKPRSPASSLTHADRALLTQFVENGPRGVLNRELAQATGRGGKSIKPHLHEWANRIGLVSDSGVSAFAPILRADGRGYRLTEVHVRTARSLLGMG